MEFVGVQLDHRFDMLQKPLLRSFAFASQEARDRTMKIPLSVVAIFAVEQSIESIHLLVNLIYEGDFDRWLFHFISPFFHCRDIIT